MKYFGFCILFVLCFTGCSFAGSFNYASLFDYLNTMYPSGYDVISTVKDIYKGQLVFEQTRKKLNRGQELLVLKELKGKSSFIFPIKGIVKIKSIRKEQIAAELIKKFTGKIQPDDPISLPAAPRIYLKSNIRLENDSLAYNKLLEALLAQDYEVIELKNDLKIPNACSYSLLLSLEKSKENVTAKIRSVYTKSTLFSQTYPLSGETRVQIPREQFDASKEKTKNKIEQKIMSSSAKEYEITDFSENVQNFEQAFAEKNSDKKNKKYRLPRGYQRMVAAELNGTPPKELVMMSQDGLSAFSWKDNVLEILGTYLFKDKSLLGIHLHSKDLEKDKIDEILVSCGKKTVYMQAQDTEISSLLLKWQEGKFIPLVQKIPFYLRVIQDPAGEKIILGQRKKGFEQYYGPVFNVHWDQENKDLIEGSVYEPARNIYSLYQFVFACNTKNEALILGPDNYVSLYYLPDENLVDMMDMNLGQFKEATYQIRLEEMKFKGGFNERIDFKEVAAPRRFLQKKKFQNQCFLIKKGRAITGIEQKISRLFSPKNGLDSIIALKCSQNRVYKNWQSKEVPRDLIDFAFFKQDDSLRILALVRDNQGYALEIISEQRIK